MESVRILQDHPLQWRFLVVIQCQQVAIDLPPDPAIIPQTGVKKFYTLVNILAFHYVIALASKPRSLNQSFQGSDNAAGGG